MVLAPLVSNIDCMNAANESTLCMAARHGYLDIANILLSWGANLEFRYHDSVTPLFAAVENNQDEMCQFLLDRKANVNATDHRRNCALHIAAKHGFSSIVVMLMKAGAATNILNYREQTPLDVARNAEICRIILGMCNERSGRPTLC